MTEVPPHIFATAESAYYYLEHSDRNQSCIISGESGAGKVCNKQTNKYLLLFTCLCLDGEHEVHPPVPVCCDTERGSLGGATDPGSQHYPRSIRLATFQSVSPVTRDYYVFVTGNAKTLRNDNSSRFGKFIQVCFDTRGQISGSVIQDYLLEQSRITFQAPEERNYHVFYQLCAGANSSPELKKKFLMDKPQNFNFINQSG